MKRKETGRRCTFYKQMPAIPDRGCFVRLICHGGGLWDPCKDFEMCAAALPPPGPKLDVLPISEIRAIVETQRDGVKMASHLWYESAMVEVWDFLKGKEATQIRKIYAALPHIGRKAIRSALLGLKKQLRADNPKIGYWMRIGNVKFHENV